MTSPRAAHDGGTGPSVCGLHPAQGWNVVKPLSVLWWALGIAGLATTYGLFELPGLLIGLFVAAVVVTANRRRKSPLAVIDVGNVRIDFRTMTMVEGKNEYTIRRINAGKWERRAISLEAIGAAVNGRMNQLSDVDNPTTLVEAAAIAADLAEKGGGRISAEALASAMRKMPAGSEGRHFLMDTLVSTVREVSGDAAADQALKGEKDIELLQAMEQWMTDNGGFEPLPMFEAPVETAYQRYIRQG